MKAVKRYVVKCISHADRSRFKTYREIENGDVYAGWSELPPVHGSDFTLRFSRKYDLANNVRIGRIVDVCLHTTNSTARFLSLPFKLSPRLRLTQEWIEQLKFNDFIVQTENALLIVREVTQWQ